MWYSLDLECMLTIFLSLLSVPAPPPPVDSQSAMPLTKVSGPPVPMPLTPVSAPPNAVPGPPISTTPMSGGAPGASFPGPPAPPAMPIPPPVSAGPPMSMPSVSGAGPPQPGPGFPAGPPNALPPMAHLPQAPHGHHGPPGPPPPGGFSSQPGPPPPPFNQPPFPHSGKKIIMHNRVPQTWKYCVIKIFCVIKLIISNYRTSPSNVPPTSPSHSSPWTRWHG